MAGPGWFAVAWPAGGRLEGDLETASDSGGGYDLGWTSSGQWFRYTVNAASAGTYTVSFRAAAPSAVTDALHLSNASGANQSGNVSIPATGDWQNWSTVTATASRRRLRRGYTFDPSTGNTVTVTFAAAAVRYVRLAFTANTGWPAGQLSELQLYSS